ncbi:MAG TPA: STAS domain-containing protein [Streptosporangiaceae bacterium]|nr:STAS domain-containing protein [Streptosporangiaceae bacterium]
MAFTEVGMESLDLQLEPISAGACAVVRVTGDVDLATAPGLRDALNRPDADHVVVDLRGVAFLDSTGLGVLVGALKRLRRRGGTLKVVTSGTGRVRRLFELTNLSRAFDMHTTVLDAISDDTNWLAATGSDPADWCLQRGLR